MIINSNEMPEWLTNFAKAAKSKLLKSAESIDPNRISFKDAEAMGFLRSAEVMGRGTFKVAHSTGVFDAGSIWYIQEGEGGEQFLMKDMDETGEVIRRMSKLEKSASSTVHKTSMEDLSKSLDFIQANMNEYDPEKVNDEINRIEDVVITADCNLQQSSSIKIVAKVNKIRKVLSEYIQTLEDEYTEAEGDLSQLEREGELLRDVELQATTAENNRLEELIATKKSLEADTQEGDTPYVNAIADIDKEINAILGNANEDDDDNDDGDKGMDGGGGKTHIIPAEAGAEPFFMEVSEDQYQEFMKKHPEYDEEEFRKIQEKPNGNKGMDGGDGGGEGGDNSIGIGDNVESGTHTTPENQKRLENEVKTTPPVVDKGMGVDVNDVMDNLLTDESNMQVARDALEAAGYSAEDSSEIMSGTDDTSLDIIRQSLELFKHQFGLSKGMDKGQTAAPPAPAAAPAAPAAPAGDVNMKITEELYDSPEMAETGLSEYKTSNAGDMAEYEIKQDVEGGTGKFKVYEKMASYTITSGRIHNGKFVRASKGDNLVKCSTSNCAFQDSKNAACTKKAVRIAGNSCTDFVITAADKQITSDKSPTADLEKEIPSDNIQELGGEEGGENAAPVVNDDQKLAPAADEDPNKKLADLKSEIWEQAGKESMDENLDFDRASDNMFAKIVAKLEESLGGGSITEEEYNSLMDDLEAMKEQDVFKDYLQNELNDETAKEDASGEANKDQDDIKPPDGAAGPLDLPAEDEIPGLDGGGDIGGPGGGTGGEGLY